MTETTLEEALAASQSESWQDRVEAGRALARAPLDLVDLAIKRLLDDGDIGVIKATADALVKTGEPNAVALILARLADSDEQVGQTLLWTIWPAEHLYDLPIADLIRAAMRTGGPKVREGGQLALDWHHPAAGREGPADRGD